MKFSELYEAYWHRHVKLRHKRPENVHYFWRAHGEQWQDKSVAETNTEHIQEWFDRLAVSSKSSAIRAVACLSSMINWGLRRGLLKLPHGNPCVGVEKLKIKSRRRFIRPDEFERFRESLAKERQDLQDFFWLCLLTGARRGNVQSMEWSEIDPRLATWTIPPEKHKNDEEHIVALTDAALAILARRAISKGPRWVFPSHGKTGHLVEPKRAWRRITTRAKIENLRIHDLRRTLGSYLAINGKSLLMIGQVLGHIDPRSTMVYARLYVDPLREAMRDAQTVFFTKASD